MPALDTCHPQIVRSLEKSGWKVSPVPHAIRVPGRRNPLLADMRAVHDQSEIIVVEVKCFLDDPLAEIYTGISQYLIYRSLLRQSSTQLPLYLAIPNYAYHGIFKDMGMAVVTEVQMKLIVVDLNREVIEQWLE